MKKRLAAMILILCLMIPVFARGEDVTDAEGENGPVPAEAALEDEIQDAPVLIEGTESVPEIALAENEASETRYAVIYELNGGTNDASNPTYYVAGTAVQLQAPTREGYTFVNWYTDSAFTAKFSGIKASTTGDLMLYARWKLNKYKVIFDGNGADNATPEGYSQKMTYSKPAQLKKNTYTKKGLLFYEWNTKPDGSGVSYQNKQKVVDLTTGTESVTLYAQWAEKIYTVKYVLNGGKNADTNPECYTGGKTVALSEPTHKGYSFMGWYTDKKCKTECKKIKKGSKGNITLYAKWTPYDYTVKFHGNGATNGVKAYAQSFKTGEDKDLSKNKFAKTAYAFVSWNTEADGSGQKFSAGQNMKKYLPEENGAVIDLYAHWKPLMKTIEFNGVDFEVVNTKADAATFDQLTYNKCAQIVGNKFYKGKCLQIADYYVCCLYKGVTDLVLRHALKGARQGVHLKTKHFGTAEKLLTFIRGQLEAGRPVTIMVASTDHKSRHFVCCVGFKSGAKEAKTLQQTDLLILDSHDGRLESMDPTIFSDNTRVLWAQSGSYRADYIL